MFFFCALLVTYGGTWSADARTLSLTVNLRNASPRVPGDVVTLTTPPVDTWGVACIPPVKNENATLAPAFARQMCHSNDTENASFFFLADCSGVKPICNLKPLGNKKCPPLTRPTFVSVTCAPCDLEGGYVPNADGACVPVPPPPSPTPTPSPSPSPSPSPVPPPWQPSTHDGAESPPHEFPVHMVGAVTGGVLAVAVLLVLMWCIRRCMCTSRRRKGGKGTSVVGWENSAPRGSGRARGVV